VNPRYRLAGLVALAVVIVDQLTKAVVDAAMVPGQSIPLLPFFALSYVRNTGAAFGLFAAVPAGLRVPAFLVVTAVALVALVSFERHTPVDRPVTVAALGGILGGAVGNLICRMRYGSVIDFADLHWGTLHWPAFNVADSAITVGAAIVLLAGLRDGSRP
jgi:signal peptidase II